MLLPQLLAGLESVDSGHIDVEYDHPWLKIGRDVDGFLPAIYHSHVCPEQLQELADGFGTIVVVVHHQTLDRAAIKH